jgi:hypothetical protein
VSAARRALRTVLLALLVAFAVGFGVGTWLRCRMERPVRVIGAAPPAAVAPGTES